MICLLWEYSENYHEQKLEMSQETPFICDYQRPSQPEHMKYRTEKYLEDILTQLMEFSEFIDRDEKEQIITWSGVPSPIEELCH